MRTIKFRIWDTHNKIWLDPKVFSVGCDDGAVRNKECRGCIGGVELVQFTGLLDRNGKEIYEGDIVEFVEESYDFMGTDKKVKREVKWQDYYGAGWEFGDSHKDGEKRFSFPFYQEETEVIGNIYENKELVL